LSLLDIDNLKTYYMVKRGYVKAVDGVSFSVNKGEATGLAGESGCGKTTVAISILKILPPGGKIVSGHIFFNGSDLVALDEDTFREEVRWKQISVVFQGAMNALNPLFRVGDQIVEAIMLHEKDVSRKEAYERAAKLFELVGIPPSRIDNYPHEFSGGMKQRAMIAMALACNPSLLIADEPSTALDVIVAAQILKLLKDLKSKLGLSMMLITHDLSIIAEICESTVIMYGGKVMEYGDTVEVFKNPLHPYTVGLISAFPNIRGERTEMVSIPGQPPDLLEPPVGCVFHPRCKYAMEICRKKEPVYFEFKKGHFVSCHLISER